MQWLYPASSKYYDVIGALSQPMTYWPMSSNVEVGDTLFLYLSAPLKQIGFQASITQIHLEYETVLEAIAPFIKDEQGKKQPKGFMKLEQIRAFELGDSSPFSLEKLKANGLCGRLMGARKLDNNPELLAYIERLL